MDLATSQMSHRVKRLISAPVTVSDYRAASFCRLEDSSSALCNNIVNGIKKNNIEITKLLTGALVCLCVS